MEFDKSKGFCEGAHIKDNGCDVTFHELRHTHDEVALKNCKKCSCPPARTHRKLYQAEKQGRI